MKTITFFGAPLLALSAFACSATSSESSSFESNQSNFDGAGAEWLATSPTQCGSNPWESEASEAADESTRVLGFFRSQGIEIEQIGFIHPSEPMVVCMACQCPRGDTLVVKAKDASAARALTARFDFAPLKGALAIAPKQCGMNPWQGDAPVNDEAHALIAWTSTVGAPVSAVGFVTPTEPMMVCMACQCSRGDLAVVLAEGEAAVKLKSFGWHDLAN